MSTYEILEKALALIEDEENWSQIIALELGHDGKPVRCCTHGAMNWALGLNGELVHTHPAWLALTAAIPVNGDICGPIDFNDTPGRKHSEVIQMWQKAIRTEKEKAGIPISIPEEEKACV